MTQKITNEYGQAIFNLPWLVAQDEGLFAAEDIEVSFVRGRNRDPNLPPVTDPTKVDPFWRHGMFEEGQVQSFQACEWGQIRRSYDSCSGGRVVMQRPAVVSHAIFVRPDSPIVEAKDLRNKTIAVNFHAGSHYITLQLLEGFMERDAIKTVHFGQGQARYQGMLDGRFDACTLMEPFIALAEKDGCKLIAEAFVTGLEMASEEIDEETLAGLNRALSEAARRIEADKRRYVHFLIDDLPAGLGPLALEDFNLGRIRAIPPRPYPQEDFERTKDWMVGWGLIPADASFESVVDNRLSITR
jgi:NitT/TauT family transport system substrate-binding protein